jgi:hypothetical protein
MALKIFDPSVASLESFLSGVWMLPVGGWLPPAAT